MSYCQKYVLRFFFKNCHVSSDYQYVERKENPWFNEICQEKRYIFLQKLSLFRQNKNFQSRVAMTRARSDYK